MNKRKIKVMVYGTFDIVHPGHLYFLRQAKRLGDVLVVSVSRDENAKKFKGYYPIFSQSERLEIVRGLKMVDKAILGDKDYYLPHTLREKPGIIALGYDQTAYEKHLRQDMKKGKLKVRLVRLKAYRPGKYKSAAYKQKISKFQFPNPK